jgi:hypothetical protein
LYEYINIDRKRCMNVICSNGGYFSGKEKVLAECNPGALL